MLEILEKKGIEPLKTLIKNIGGWPVLEGQNWKPNAMFKWTDLVLKMRSEGISGAYLLGVGVGNDLKQREKRIITVI